LKIIFENIDLDKNSTIEYSEFKVCGMNIIFEDLTGKLIRLFKLHKTTNPIVTLDEIMEAIQDGNKN